MQPYSYSFSFQYEGTVLLPQKLPFPESRVCVGGSPAPGRNAPLTLATELCSQRTVSFPYSGGEWGGAGAGPGAISQSLRVQGTSLGHSRSSRDSPAQMNVGREAKEAQGALPLTRGDYPGGGQGVGWQVHHPSFPLLRRPRVSWLKTGAVVSQRHRGRREGRWVGRPARF